MQERSIAGIVALLLLLWACGSSSAQPSLPEGLPPATPPPASQPATQPSGPALPEGLGPPGDQPALPGGLPGGDQPSLPGGLPGGDQPALPGGLAASQPATRPATQPAKTFLQSVKDMGLTGFWETRGGVRTQHPAGQRQASLGETRFQLDWEKHFKGDWTAHVVADFLYDAVDEHHTVDLERGRGWLDLRQANVSFRPLKWLDVRAGRQILTWGTGDLLFINDLFPKDFVSFFLGRDEEYLKVPSDAIKLSAYSDLANLDVVYTPRFDPDRFISGRRLSFFNPLAGRVVGREQTLSSEIPARWFQNDEWAARLYKTIEGYELAAYGYWGYWKSPGGVNPFRGEAIFPRLNVYGGSARGPLLKGIGNVELGYYDSRNDRHGNNPFINNSQFRILGGYEQDLPQIATDLTVSMQYELDVTAHHSRLVRALPPGAPEPDELRHVLTWRVTKKLLNQNLTVGLFVFYSPSDGDAYFRPKVHYKIDDQWSVEVGGNVFVGRENYTLFGQFERDSNVYTALRYGF
ncbi:MAG: hypothetical protein BWX88_01030 [Planctomycetes bacterium ADurb.Bin126]|nr:MAG: hypothetical protein BWX88_01030 [Planctomycetes bacterium ADurb.Bin126]HOD82298.1 hypothetical protein [Phycisphaerae bacterium]HQL74899.1 hypothetical protein [Phycisphaerae bacterium]